MLQKSLKWMILTLLLAGLLIGGVVWLVSALRDAPAAAQEAPSASQPGATVAATPAGNSPTPAATPTPGPGRRAGGETGSLYRKNQKKKKKKN